MAAQLGDKIYAERMGIGGTVTVQEIVNLAGGGGSPAGANGEVQFNNNGVFGASQKFKFNEATGDIQVEGVTAEPSTPASGKIALYTKYIAGKASLKIKDANGLDYSMQAALWGNNITLWNNTNATAGSWIGTVGTGAGTFTQALPSIASVYTSIKRARYANVVTTLNQVLGQRQTESMFFRGSVAGQGGFFFFARMGFDAWQSGCRFFAGMHNNTNVVTANPSLLNNTVGFCIDDTDNGAISFLTRGTVATKASTGFTASAGVGYDLYIFCAPNSSQISWRIFNLNTSVEVSGIATLTLPNAISMLTAGVLASNAALTPVTSVQLGINKIYIDTDH